MDRKAPRPRRGQEKPALKEWKSEDADPRVNEGHEIPLEETKDPQPLPMPPD
jgi:hypothetical protein